MLYNIVAQASGRADQTLEGWTTQQLARLWGALPEEVTPAAKDLIAIPDERLEQKIIDWFGRDKRAIGFLNEFRSKRRKLHKKPAAELIRPESQMGLEGVKVYKKDDKFEDEFMTLARKRKEEEEKQAQLQKEKLEREQRAKEAARQKRKNKKSKKAQEKQSLNQQGELYLPGRNVCDCQARRHPLLGNCLWCGKIICKQEGEGPCLFCGHEVEMRNKRAVDFDDDEELLSNPDLMQAIQHKDKLLEYDRNAAKRTAVSVSYTHLTLPTILRV
eukprot:TRINITY_DN4442_c0_g1_i3.p1 TRINITY_DN4442_c0_g1~~TRINITY_DN4442_c0_g1_i3.p1  ORF type:complete len:273 (-),score=85.10 TRINITY_DN4442_c0_g1_i3:6-824(-)